MSYCTSVCRAMEKKSFPIILYPMYVIDSMLHCPKYHLSYSTEDVGHVILHCQNVTYPTIQKMLDMSYCTSVYRGMEKKTFPIIYPTYVKDNMLHCPKCHLSYSMEDVGHVILHFCL